ncbi:MAG: UDP-N-acetylmuramoyl-tripeptide--D-alanyl-D-alanine ligase [Ruminococcaceae bacterium]|nr:UDP-N-acetylmuramoyl-tripeptide--D-alanyl-D-alanine ligase [Oscillospiraceae bacterium]
MKTQFDTLSHSTSSLAAIIGGTVIRESSASHRGLVTDSRIVEPGNIFLALRGENADGHNFIGGAVVRGATCVIAERVAEETMRAMTEGCAVILVPNTLSALGALGRWHMLRTNPYVIAVTGSVGKTTTKQMIHAVLSAAHPTMRTEGNYNNEIGLPLTLMQLRENDRIAVLEAGMSYPGELHRLSLICTPDTVVITNIGTSHIENLGSREGIRDAKLEMLDGMKAGGTVILNGDEPLLMEKRGEILARGLIPVYIAKTNPDADYLAENIRMTTQDCTFDMRCTADDTVIRDLHIPVTGEHNVSNAMAAYLCGQAQNMTDADIRRGLDAFENTGMRQKIFDWRGITVIEDCYNASPESMEAALRVLGTLSKETNGGRSVAVLGDMKELGSYAPRLHKRVGRFLGESGIDDLVTVGEEAADIAAGAVIGGMAEEHIMQFPAAGDDSIPAIADYLRAHLVPGDTVLFKASRAMALERIVDALIAE